MHLNINFRKKKLDVQKWPDEKMHLLKSLPWIRRLIYNMNARSTGENRKMFQN